MVEIKQRKVCGNCRAFWPVSKRCSLGYRVEPYRGAFGIITDAKPQEPCPKPLTVSESSEANQFYKKKTL